MSTVVFVKGGEGEISGETFALPGVCLVSTLHIGYDLGSLVLFNYGDILQVVTDIITYSARFHTVWRMYIIVTYKPYKNTDHCNILEIII